MGYTWIYIYIYIQCNPKIQYDDFWFCLSFWRIPCWMNWWIRGWLGGPNFQAKPRLTFVMIESNKRIFQLEDKLVCSIIRFPRKYYNYSDFIPCWLGQTGQTSLFPPGWHSQAHCASWAPFWMTKLDAQRIQMFDPKRLRFAAQNRGQFQAAGGAMLPDFLFGQQKGWKNSGK